MATRAETWKSKAERSKPPRPAKHRRDVDGAKASLLAELGSGSVHRELAATGLQNVSHGKKASYALEDSTESKRPSRKSTRRSSSLHEKAATTMTEKQKVRVSAPSARRATGK